MIFNTFNLNNDNRADPTDDNNKKTNQVNDLTVDTLSVYYICTEYSAANMNKDYTKSPTAKLYNFLVLIRTVIVLLVVLFLEDNRVIQAWIFLVVNFIYLLTTQLISEHLEFNVLTTIKEILFFTWSIIILVNAYDDIQPKIELF